jgi:hypothetical protein
MPRPPLLIRVMGMIVKRMQIFGTGQ